MHEDEGAMQERALSPAAVVMQMNNTIVPHLLYVVVELGIADLLVTKPQTADELAQATGAHAPALFRMLRGLASYGLFTLDSEQRFGLTPLSEVLRADHPESLASNILYVNHPDTQRMLGDSLNAIMTGQQAFAHLLGTDAFSYYRDHPEVGHRFNQFMSDQFNQDVASVVACYDFQPYRHVVDVGGGIGSLILAILRANPHMQGTLFDVPYSALAAQQALDDAELADRCRFVAGDFFQAVPAGGDIYTLKNVVHDWSDEQAITLLRVCGAAMQPGSTLLLIENVFPDQGVPTPYLAAFDLVMLTLYGGHERTAQQYRDLLAAAGFQVDRIIPTHTAVSLIEARLA